MRVVRRSIVLVAAALTLGALSLPQALAQEYPDRSVKVVVPMSPGGAVDTLARLLTHHLTAGLGKPVIVENKPGANGIIGSDLVAKSPSDGYTLLMPDLGTLTIGPATTPTMPFDAVNDFAPVTMVAYAPYGVAVHPGLPVNSLQELIAYAKANPGKINYATLGTGSASHLAGIDLAMRAGVNWTYVPYKGGGQALPDVATGNAHVIAISLTSTLPFVKSGRLRLLAVSSKERLSFLPDVPTIHESYPGFEAAFYSALLAPKGTPKPIVDKLRNETIRVMNMPEVKARLADQATVVMLSTPDELTRFVASENAKYKAIVKAAGVKFD